MSKQNSATRIQEKPTPQFGDRLKFVIWLSAKTLGVESAKELAAVLGKRQGQLSSWLKEDPRPEWGNIKLIADRVGLSANWLDDPASQGAIEPPEWGEWWTSRVARLTARADAGQKRPAGKLGGGRK